VSVQPPQTEHTYRVFYRDYVHDVSISSTQPEPLAAGRLGALAEQLLQHADNFLGVVDDQENILQLYLDDDEQLVLVELVAPEGGGCLRQSMSCESAYALLERLPRVFVASLLPGAERID
jgi:hypothetical protein